MFKHSVTHTRDNGKRLQFIQIPQALRKRPRALPVLDAEFSELLAHLHRAGAFGYWWSCNQDTGERRTAWYSVGSPSPVPSMPGWDCYFSVHPTTVRGTATQRAKEDEREIAAVNCLYMEIDGKDYATDKDTFLANREYYKAKALQDIKTLPLPPSVMIDSCGGYHCYWLLDKPFIIDSAEARDHIAGIQARWVDTVGGDASAKDLYRVLRVPGTVNHKYNDAPTVSIAENNGLLYSIEELAALLPEPAPAPVAPAVTTTANRKEALSERAAKRRAAYVERAIDSELEKLAVAPQGAGNNTLFKVTARCYEFVASGDVQDSDIARAVEQTAAPYIARDGEQEFLKTFNSGRRSGLAQPAAFPDFEQGAEPQTEPVKVLPTGADDATSELERYQQLTATLWNIITASADGWDASAKVLAAYGELARFREQADVLTIEGGAAAVAPRVGMSKTTVGTHAARLEAAGLWEWRKGAPVLHDNNRRPVNSGVRVDPTRTPEAQGLHFENDGSILYLLPLPTNSLPPLPRTKRQETQKQREEEKRADAQQARRDVRELSETLEKLEAARCPHCEAQGTLGAHCNDCGAIVSTPGAGKTFTYPAPTQAESRAPAATDPVQSFNPILLQSKVLPQADHDGHDKPASGEPSVCVQSLNREPDTPLSPTHADDELELEALRLAQRGEIRAAYQKAQAMGDRKRLIRLTERLAAIALPGGQGGSRELNAGAFAGSRSHKTLPVEVKMGDRYRYIPLSSSTIE